ERVKSLKKFMKLSFETSQYKRNKSIKVIEKTIECLKLADVETINKIADMVDTYDLCDNRYGKTIKEDSYNKLIDIAHKNKDLAETESALRKNLVCYKQAEKNL
ncbi:MAG: hypothetical protein ACI4R8_00605, partial [Candidatus Caccovivens sp.]